MAIVFTCLAKITATYDITQRQKLAYNPPSTSETSRETTKIPIYPNNLETIQKSIHTEIGQGKHTPARVKHWSSLCEKRHCYFHHTKIHGLDGCFAIHNVLKLANERDINPNNNILAKNSTRQQITTTSAPALSPAPTPALIQQQSPNLTQILVQQYQRPQNPY